MLRLYFLIKSFKNFRIEQLTTSLSQKLVEETTVVMEEVKVEESSAKITSTSATTTTTTTTENVEVAEEAASIISTTPIPVASASLEPIKELQDYNSWLDEIEGKMPPSDITEKMNDQLKEAQVGNF